MDGLKTIVGQGDLYVRLTRVFLVVVAVMEAPYQNDLVCLAILMDPLPLNTLGF